MSKKIIKKREKPDCKACQGKGYTLAWTKDRNGKRISYERECRNCSGTGKAW